MPSTATASTSILAPGTARPLTSTSVAAGRAAPKTRCRTGSISGRSDTSVRNTATLTTSAAAQPAAARIASSSASTCSACAATSSAPDECAGRIDGQDPRNEEEAAGTHGVRRVRQHRSLREGGSRLATHAGTRATASTSIFAPGITSAGTSTSVDAGRVSPNTSCAHRVDQRPVGDVREEHGHLDHVGKRASGSGEHCTHVLEHAAGLRDDVVSADQLPVLVDRDDAADEEQLASLDGVGEVRDRLRLAVDPVLDPAAHRSRRTSRSAPSGRRSRPGRPRWRRTPSSVPVCRDRSRRSSTTRRSSCSPSVTGVTLSVAW